MHMDGGFKHFLWVMAGYNESRITMCSRLNVYRGFTLLNHDS